jgi:putative sigma-54 modulation protein
LKINAKDEAEDNNMYSAIDGVTEKIKTQITKFKDKQRRHLAGDKQSIKDEVLDAIDTE